jgi:hypothetical protein
MEEEIRALLLVDSGVSGHVGTRVNFGAHPQGQPFPAIVLNVVSDVQGYNIDSPSGISRARLQVDCYGLTYGTAKQLSRAVLSLLSGYSGGVVMGPVMQEHATRERAAPTMWSARSAHPSTSL